MVHVDFYHNLSQSSDEPPDQVHSAVFHCVRLTRFLDLFRPILTIN